MTLTCLDVYSMVNDNMAFLSTRFLPCIPRSFRPPNNCVFIKSHFVVTLSLLLSSLILAVRLSKACSNLDAVTVPCSIVTLRVTKDRNVDLTDMKSVYVGKGEGGLEGKSEG